MRAGADLGVGDGGIGARLLALLGDRARGRGGAARLPEGGRGVEGGQEAGGAAQSARAVPEHRGGEGARGTGA